jgi:pilus assembly protein Flp/PilA
VGGTHVGGAGTSTPSHARAGAADWFFQGTPVPPPTTKGRRMTTIMNGLVALNDRLFTHDERGATATEYALLLAFIAVVIIGAVTLFGSNLTSLFRNAASSV